MGVAVWVHFAFSLCDSTQAVGGGAWPLRQNSEKCVFIPSTVWFQKSALSSLQLGRDECFEFDCYKIL